MRRSQSNYPIYDPMAPRHAQSDAFKNTFMALTKIALLQVNRG
ncbi:hypothetical protein FRUB_05074 [Fimbriiglobus ruber]|uniref:Uncharacterized protein n=1 Tax=Fimbriiglobus ruber TaxID=1908690 RepID=A0A225DUT1_9BACT|nr:hypothetical protein FRUB_05074 [Fimbriiglobus ruber]